MARTRTRFRGHQWRWLLPIIIVLVVSGVVAVLGISRPRGTEAYPRRRGPPRAGVHAPQRDGGPGRPGVLSGTPTRGPGLLHGGFLSRLPPAARRAAAAPGPVSGRRGRRHGPEYRSARGGGVDSVQVGAALPAAECPPGPGHSPVPDVQPPMNMASMGYVLIDARGRVRAREVDPYFGVHSEAILQRLARAGAAASPQ